MAEQQLTDLIADIEDALTVLEYYDDVRITGDMDQHTDTVIVVTGKVLVRALEYLRKLSPEASVM